MDNPVGEAIAFALNTLRKLIFAEFFVLVWAAGMVLVLLRSAQTRWSLARWWRMAGPVDAGQWEDQLEEAGYRVFLTRKVDVRQTTGISSPMSWGVWSPRLLLPVEAAGWTSERKLYAVMHEFVHVRRRDAWHDLLSVLFVAVFWFLPMAWMLRRQLQVQREASCDDAVLTLGANPQEYAQMLIDVAKDMKGLRRTPGVAMTISRPSQLEGRILSVLDSSPERRAPRPALQRSLAVAWAVLALVVSALSPAVGQADPRLMDESMLITESKPQFQEVPDDEKLEWLQGNSAWHDPLVRGEELSERPVGSGEPAAKGGMGITSALEDGEVDSVIDTGSGTDPVEDFLAVAGLRMADAVMAELGRTVSEVDWAAVLEKSGIALSDVEVTLPDGGSEEVSIDVAMDKVSRHIESAVVHELEQTVLEHPGSDEARRALKALVEIDSKASRDALYRLKVRQLPR